MNIVDAAQMGLKRTFDFTGRSTRPEFFYWLLFVMTVGVITFVMDGILSKQVIGVPFSPDYVLFNPIASLLLALPGFAIWARRIRDAGRDPRLWVVLPTFLIICGALLGLSDTAPILFSILFYGVASLFTIGAMVIVFFRTKEEEETE